MPYTRTSRTLPLQYPTRYNTVRTIGPVVDWRGNVLLEVNSVHPPAFLYQPPSRFTALPRPFGM